MQENRRRENRGKSSEKALQGRVERGKVNSQKNNNNLSAFVWQSFSIAERKQYEIKDPNRILHHFSF